MPLRALLDQFSSDFPGFCKVGTGHNKNINFDAKQFIAVTDSVGLLQDIHFDVAFVDEAHHPLPLGMPKCKELYQFSATHKDEPDFRYTMGRAIEDGVLSDYDITVPSISKHHEYVCLAGLLLKQAGRFRRVLAYCNTVAEAKRFDMVLQEMGLAAWHINGKTAFKSRRAAIKEFSGRLQKPVHVLVTVEVLGEGINIPNADTCMFVEPRRSYRSIVQAIGRVLRHHPAKTIAHLVLPAVAVPNQKPDCSPGGQETVKNPAPVQQLEIVNMPNKSDTQIDTVWAEAAESIKNGHGNVRPVPLPQKLLHPNGGAVPVHHHKRQRKGWNSDLWAQVNGSGQTSGGQLPAVLSNPGSKKDPQRVQITWNEKGLNQMRVQSSCLSAGPLDSIHTGGSTGGRRNSSRSKTDHSEHLHQAGALQDGEAYLNDTIYSSSLHSDHAFSLQIGGEIGQHPDLVDTYSRKRQHLSWRTFRRNNRDTEFGAKYDYQLERFLSVLLQADDRLVGTSPMHRIQIVDCSLGLEGELGVEWMMKDVLSRLDDILHQKDWWETRLKQVEAFVAQHGKLPRQGRAGGSTDLAEAVLGNWIHNQGRNFHLKLLPLHKLQQLLTGSSPLIRARAEGWVAGGRAGVFLRRCAELRRYIEAFGHLPQKSPTDPFRRLAAWLFSYRNTAGYLFPARKKLLMEVHPLVKALLQKWENTPVNVVKARFDRRLKELERFVEVQGRLPRSDEFSWLGRQVLLLSRGVLPFEQAEQLRCSHPLIAAACEREQNKDSQ